MASRKALTGIRASRGGFTLIELLVTMALIVLILTVLAEAFVVGLDSLGKLKAIGDMSDRLRAAANHIRRDLGAEHFQGSFRLSDARFGNKEKPAVGFFMIKQYGPSVAEGLSDGVASFRAPSANGKSHVLYMTVKLRGNGLEDFFAAPVPDPFPMLAFPDRTTYFNQPDDARRQNPNQLIYTSQWAEVAYFLQPRPDITAKGTPLFSLHRIVRVLVPENMRVNNQVPAGMEKSYQGFSYRVSGSYLNFNTPFDVTNPSNRSLQTFIMAKDPTDDTAPQFAGVESMLLTDVVSFTVQAIRRPSIDPWRGQPAFGIQPLNSSFSDDFGSLDATTGIRTFDSSNAGDGIIAVQIIIRVWDFRTDQTRQITLIQDM